MSKEKIAAIIKEQGCMPRFKDLVNPKGNGRRSTYVYACRGNSTARYLGKLEAVEQMSEQELRDLIAAKFAANKKEVVR